MRPNNLKRHYRYRTDNPDTRRCCRCGIEQPLDAFRRPMTAALAKRYGYVDKIIEGHTFADGRFIRGHYRAHRPHTRLRLSQKCNACHAIPKPRHQSTASFDAVMEQITRLRRNTMRKLLDRTQVAALAKEKLTIEQIHNMTIDERLAHGTFSFNPERLYYGGKLRVLLDYAASEARKKKNADLACPPTWEKLLKKEMLTDVNDILAFISRLRRHRAEMSAQKGE